MNSSLQLMSPPFPRLARLQRETTTQARFVHLGLEQQSQSVSVSNKACPKALQYITAMLWLFAKTLYWTNSLTDSKYESFTHPNIQIYDLV